MKKYIIGFILGGALAISLAAISQDKMEMHTFQSPCMSLEYLDKITEEYNELPILRADSVRKDGEENVSHVTVLYMNMETKSWTLAEKMTDSSYCIISVGSDMEPVKQEIRDKLQKSRKSKMN